MSNPIQQQQEAVQFVSDYLRENPDFFRRHPELFIRLNLPRQNRDGTRSIIECQNDVLRATLTTMEVREEEFKIQEKVFEEAKDLENVFDLAMALLSCRDDIALPEVALSFFKQRLRASHGLIRLWPVVPNYSFFPFAERLGAEIEDSVAQLDKPFAGENFGDDIAKWLRIDPVETRGVLLIPLKTAAGKTFGLICLCDPNVNKFTESYKEKFLSSAAKLCEAALAPLTSA